MRKLKELGVDFNPATYDAVPSWKEYFDNQENAVDAVEKTAAENYGGEPKAVLFFKMAATGADPHWRDVSIPQIEDEEGHTDMGRDIMKRYATTPEKQQRIREISTRQQWLSVEAMRQLNDRLGLPNPAAAQEILSGRTIRRCLACRITSPGRLRRWHECGSGAGVKVRHASPSMKCRRSLLRCWSQRPVHAAPCEPAVL